MIAFTLPMMLTACTPIPGGPGDKFATTDGWILPFGGELSDEMWGIDAVGDGSGDVIVSSFESRPTAMPDVYVYRITPDGEVMWEFTWGDDSLDKSFKVTVADGVAYVGGTTYHDLSNDSADAFVLALDAATGTQIWEWVRDGGFGYEEVDGISVVDDAIYLSGWTTGEATGNDGFVAKLNTDGEEAWFRSVGGQGWDEFNGHNVVIDDAIFVAGLMDGTRYATGGDAHLWSFATADGAQLWDIGAPATSAWDDALGLTTDGTNLYTVGVAPTPAAGVDLWILRVPLAGGTIDEFPFGGAGTQYGRSIDWDAAGNLVIGMTTNATGEDDSGLLRVNPTTMTEVDWTPMDGAADDRIDDLIVTDTTVWTVGTTDSFGAGKSDGFLRMAAQ